MSQKTLTDDLNPYHDSRESGKSRSSTYTSLASFTENFKSKYPRKEFGSSSDFLFACVGSVIGYGNIWRFPAHATKYGGGKFTIITYFCFMCILYLFQNCFIVSYILVTTIYAILIGIPMCCLEIFLGQLSQLGIAKTLGLMSPMFQGRYLNKSFFVAFINLFILRCWLGDDIHNIFTKYSIHNEHYILSILFLFVVWESFALVGM